jgi:hypothetical protein
MDLLPEEVTESDIDKELDERIKRIHDSIERIRTLVADLKIDDVKVVEEFDEQPR